MAQLVVNLLAQLKVVGSGSGNGSTFIWTLTEIIVIDLLNYACGSW